MLKVVQLAGRVEHVHYSGCVLNIFRVSETDKNEPQSLSSKPKENNNLVRNMYIELKPCFYNNLKKILLQ